MRDVLGPLAPRPGDRFVWLVAEDADEPLLVGYAETGADALALARERVGMFLEIEGEG